MTEAATEAGPAPHQLTPIINATDGEHDQVFGSLHVVLKEQQGFLQMVQMARTPPPSPSLMRKMLMRKRTRLGGLMSPRLSSTTAAVEGVQPRAGGQFLCAIKHLQGSERHPRTFL